MKLLLILISFFWISPAQQVSIYTLQFANLEGSQVQLAVYQNRKIIIAPFNGANPEGNFLRYLDTIQRAHPAVQVILVPGKEFGSNVNMQTLRNLRSNLSSALVMAAPMNVMKSSGADQHPLFKWLTRVQRNEHFDADAQAGGQLFMISAKGNLYSVLGTGAPNTVVNDVLLQAID